MSQQPFLPQRFVFAVAAATKQTKGSMGTPFFAPAQHSLSQKKATS
jgi:hypothetical protein